MGLEARARNSAAKRTPTGPRGPIIIARASGAELKRIDRLREQMILPSETASRLDKERHQMLLEMQRERVAKQ